MKRKVIIAIAATAAVVTGGAVAGTAIGADDEPETVASAPRAEAAAAPAADDDAGTGTGAGEVLATALAATPGVVTEIEHGDGWEVEIYGDDGKWHDLRIGDDGAEVLDNRVATDDDGDDDDRAPAETPGIDAAEAIALAEEDTSATFREASLDDGHWDVELRGDDGTEHELTIDPASGEITSREQESASADDDQDETDDSPEDATDDTGQNDDQDAADDTTDDQDDAGDTTDDTNDDSADDQDDATDD
ncbi:PepSY domain-containing protein [Streptomyces specialis]|uniref:PepSY domain-containing protein n=1 Tax=Streptomyces specialis TaxID=498367 RepID=UPI00073EC7A9|nr:PepSY domain-containing protein [Streptomyces specialis]